MQTILGSGGIIATELAKALTAYTTDIRLVSRNPEKVNSTDLLFQADLLDAESVEKAVGGSDVVYVTIGFPYGVKVWQEMWPTFIVKVIKACIKHDAKLVFFDNVYMYDPEHLNGMTEETPINPSSSKGKIRDTVAHLITRTVKQGKLTALIARCADYYGPGIERNGMINEMVFKNFAAGKKANWLSSVQYKHSLTYTPDAGKATALLGNTEDAYNQVWHLPTAPNPLTGKEWIEAIAAEMDVKPRYQVATPLILSIMGWFTPVLGELKEMLYQYDRHYVFDSSKFENRFGILPTSYAEGIAAVVKADYSTDTLGDK